MSPSELSRWKVRQRAKGKLKRQRVEPEALKINKGYDVITSKSHEKYYELGMEVQ
jgi:hypothetical protein